MKNKYTKEISNEELNWAFCDLDGTLAEGLWPKRGIGKLRKAAWKRIKALLDEEGLKLCIYTARPWADYSNIKKWCEDNGITVKLIVCGKPLAKYYIDDRNKFIKL